MKNKLITTKEESKNTLFEKSKKNEYFRVARGIYSDNMYYDMLEVYSLRFPYGIFTMNTLFSIYGMTDYFIDDFHIATKRGSRKISDDKVVQHWQSRHLFNIGRTKTVYNGIEINVYDKERLLIELFRNSNNVSRRVYKQVIKYYRDYLNTGFKVYQYQKYCEEFIRDKDILKERFRKEIQ